MTVLSFLPPPARGAAAALLGSLALGVYALSPNSSDASSVRSTVSGHHSSVSSSSLESSLSSSRSGNNHRSFSSESKHSSRFDSEVKPLQPFSERRSGKTNRSHTSSSSPHKLSGKSTLENVALSNETPQFNSAGYNEGGLYIVDSVGMHFFQGGDETSTASIIDLRFENDDLGAVYNSATYDLGSVIGPIASRIASSRGLTIAQVYAGLNMTIMSEGGVDIGWHPTISEDGLISLTHGDGFPDFDYEVWDNVPNNPVASSLFLTINFGDFLDYDGNGVLEDDELFERFDPLPGMEKPFMGYHDMDNLYFSYSPLLRNVGDTVTLPDTDNDGWPDYYENGIFGTDPDSGADFPRPALRLSGGEAVLRFPVDDRGWRIERSADLAGWTDAAGGPLDPDPGYAEPGEAGWREVSFPGEGRGFFRVRRRDR